MCRNFDISSRRHGSGLGMPTGWTICEASAFMLGAARVIAIDGVSKESASKEHRYERFRE
jgi:hypothetical protein